MNSGAGDTTQLVPGFPIRTPWDHSSVDSSPRPIAASHVLHRLLVPRHPPCALSNLTTKMLASTVQFSNNATQPTHTTPAPTTTTRPTRGRHGSPVYQPGSAVPENPTRRRPAAKPAPGRGCFLRTQQGVLNATTSRTPTPLHTPTTTPTSSRGNRTGSTRGNG